MAAPVKMIEYGSANSPLKNEPSGTPVVLVDSLTKNFTRTETLAQDAQGATTYAKYTDPTATLEYTGKIVTSTGLANQHPGSTVSSLSNFATEEHGCDPSVGKIIYKDPSRSYSRDNDFIELSFTAQWFPFLTA